MQPIIPLWLIWFSGICDDLKNLFMALGTVGIVVLGIATFIYFMEEGELLPHFIKLLTISVIVLFVSVLVPTQKTVYTIMVASQITPSNIQLVGGTLKSTMDYMFDKTEKLIKDVKSDK